MTLRSPGRFTATAIYAIRHAEGHYPGQWPEVPDVEARRAIDIAKSLVLVIVNALKARGIDTSSAVDLQFVRELEQSGFLKSLKGN